MTLLQVSEATTKIYLVRHGQTDSNRDDVIQGLSNSELYNAINAEGIRQAERLALKFLHVHFDAVFTSNLMRARQTCDIITKRHVAIEDVRLCERDFRSWEGRQWSEFDLNRVENWSQVEDDRAVLDRTLAVLHEVGDAFFNRTVLVVSHGGVMRNLLIHILNLNCLIDDISIGNLGYYILEYSFNREHHLRLSPEREGIIFPPWVDVP